MTPFSGLSRYLSRRAPGTPPALVRMLSKASKAAKAAKTAKAEKAAPAPAQNRNRKLIADLRKIMTTNTAASTTRNPRDTYYPPIPIDSRIPEASTPSHPGDSLIPEASTPSHPGDSLIPEASTPSHPGGTPAKPTTSLLTKVTLAVNLGALCERAAQSYQSLKEKLKEKYDSLFKKKKNGDGEKGKGNGNGKQGKCNGNGKKGKGDGNGGDGGGGGSGSGGGGGGGEDDIVHEMMRHVNDFF
ncbi:translation initiation factor IF-2-like [Dioscorea cayenensis subsp. rotundata]|uniref:Translation initiation factor IF-2-like n=1 Tax=Dioscorea cayennensis subsp. rotundata TaxID=55577 RepID=A0AB40AQ18_DIOCR|nr:translation initiation factor IF-2-like [Dioscorea cayenensis subsp. rotundata]